MTYCIRCLFLVASSLVVLPTSAQSERPWSVSVHAGSANVDRLVRESGPWWSDVDDRRAALAIGVGYDPLPVLGLRALYERANGFDALNVCPDGQACPAVSISEDMDFSHWQVVLEPRYPMTNEWSLFASLGVMDWRLSRDDVLPGDSGTDFVYGAGVTWRTTGQIELRVEYQRSGVDYDAFRLGGALRF